MNNLSIVGRVISAVKLSEGAKPRANLTVAVPNPFGKKKEGTNYTEDTLFSLTIWGESAEAAAKQLSKGDNIAAQGAVSAYMGKESAGLSVSVERWRKIWTGGPSGKPKGRAAQEEEHDPFADGAA